LEQEKKKQMIKFWIAISILLITVVVIATIMIKYEVEGDQNMPFNLSKIILVSKAEGIQVEGETKWNFDIYQYNDVYLYIDKNEGYKGKNNIINNVRIENIQLLKTPEIGEVKTYMPNSTEGRKFDYSENYIIKNSLTYKGAIRSNYQTLEIGNQGGEILFSFVNTRLKKYSSNKDNINHDTLLKECDVKNEELEFKASFDLIIELSNYSYKANITLDFPQGNIIHEGTGILEITDMSNIAFKRMK